jgi:hypothetical protein
MATRKKVLTVFLSALRLAEFIIVSICLIVVASYSGFQCAVYQWHYSANGIIAVAQYCISSLWLVFSAMSIVLVPAVVIIYGKITFRRIHKYRNG